MRVQSWCPGVVAGTVAAGSDTVAVSSGFLTGGVTRLDCFSAVFGRGLSVPGECAATQVTAEDSVALKLLF